MNSVVKILLVAVSVSVGDEARAAACGADLEKIQPARLTLLGWNLDYRLPQEKARHEQRAQRADAQPEGVAGRGMKRVAWPIEDVTMQPAEAKKQRGSGYEREQASQLFECARTVLRERRQDQEDGKMIVEKVQVGSGWGNQHSVLTQMIALYSGANSFHMCPLVQGMDERASR